MINIPLFNYFNSKKEDILNDFRSLTGYEISYKRISPNILGKIKIFEVVLYHSGGNRLALGNIEISYSFLSLIRRKTSFLNIINKITFKSVDLHLNKETDLKQLSKIINNSKNKKNKIIDNIQNITVEIINCKINIFDNRQRSNINILSKNLKINLKKNINILANIDIKIINKNEEIFNTSIKTKGKVLRNNKSLSSVFNIDLYNTSLKDNKFISQKLYFESNGKNFTFKRLEDKLPIKLLLERKSDTYYTNINIDNLSIMDLLKSDKKSLFLPDYLTFRSKLQLKDDFTKKNGKVSSNIHYDNLFFLRNFDINFDFSLSDKKIDINNFIISNISENNKLNINGFIPLDNSDFDIIISIKDFLLPLTKINTEINIMRKNNEIDVKSTDFILNDNIIDKFNFRFLLDNNKTYIQTIDPFNGYSIDGIIQKGNLELTNNFNNFSIDKFIKSYNKDFMNTTVLNGSFPLKYINKNTHLERANFTVTNNNNEISSFNLKLANDILSVDNLIINNKNPGKINGWINFNTKPYISQIEFNSEKTDINIAAKFSKIITCSINNDLIINLDPNNNTLKISANDFKLPVKKSNTELNFNLTYNISSQSMYDNRIYIKNLNIFKGKNGFLTALISLKDKKILINNISYRDDSNRIEGSITSNLMRNDFLISGNGFLKDEAKDESYSLEYNISKKNISAKLFLTHFELKKIITGNNINGFLNARINLGGTFKKPVIDIESDISNAKINKNDFNSFISIQKNNDSLLIKNANIQIANNRLSIKKSKINLNKGFKELDISGGIYLDALQKVFKTNFKIQGKVESVQDLKNNLNINLFLEKMTLGFLKGYDLNSVEKYDDIQFNIKNIGDKLVLTNYGSKFIYAEKKENNFFIKLFKTNEEFFNGNINIGNNKELDGKLNFINFPVNIIQKILLPFVEIDDGRIKGLIELKGKLLSPEFYGNLSLIFGVISLPDFIPNSIENITGIINADKNKFLVKNVNAQVKKGLGHGYGEIIFNGWKLERYEFHINSDPIPAVINKGPVDAKGTGHIKSFVIEGRPQEFNFIGDFVIETADINLESLLGANKEKKIKNIPINVYINFTAGDRVKINHPIINGIIAQGEKFNIKFIGNEAHIYLGGKFRLKKGEVNYINKVFKIEKAEFQFYEDEIKINPNINLKAFYKTKDSKRDSTTIYMSMNDRLIPFKTNFTTIPYKSQDDINALLGLPITTEAKSYDTQSDENSNIDKSSLSSVADTTDYLSNSILFTPFENKVRKVTGLDTFSLNTKFFGNIIKSNTEENNNTLDLLDESSVTIGKYLFNELYFESIMSFNKRKEYSDNFFLPLSNQNYGLNLQLMLQLELPYISIGYSFLPKDYFNIINADHQISLEANFKF